MSLYTSSSVSQHVFTDPARLTPSSYMKPEPFWGLLSGLGPAVTHNPGVTEVDIACPRAGKQGFKRLAAEGGIRKTGRATTLSLWQQPPWHHCPLTQPAPTSWCAHTGTMTNCLFVWLTLLYRLVSVRAPEGQPASLKKLSAIYYLPVTTRSTGTGAAEKKSTDN